MKYLTLIFLFNTIVFNCISQTSLPTKKEIKAAKSDTVLDAINILSRKIKFDTKCSFDYKKNEYKIDSSDYIFNYIDSSTVNYITAIDKIDIIDKDQIEVTYGGSGPEKQKFKFIGWVNGYLIVETKFENKGWLNDKLVYHEKFHLRLAWLPI